MWSQLLIRHRLELAKLFADHNGPIIQVLLDVCRAEISQILTIKKKYCNKTSEKLRVAWGDDHRQKAEALSHMAERVI